MVSKRRMTAWVAICSVLALLHGCSDGGLFSGNDDDDVSEAQADYTTLQNQVFFQTFLLSLEITQGTSRPAFAWQATGSKYVVLTIFKEKIDLSQDRIANPEDAVWTWNTGLGQGREGNVGYDDGVDVRNGVIQDQVTPLASGSYYIAAWAYSDDYELLYSSKEHLYQAP